MVAAAPPPRPSRIAENHGRCCRGRRSCSAHRAPAPATFCPAPHSRRSSGRGKVVTRAPQAQIFRCQIFAFLNMMPLPAGRKAAGAGASGPAISGFVELGAGHTNLQGLQHAGRRRFCAALRSPFACPLQVRFQRQAGGRRCSGPHGAPPAGKWCHSQVLRGVLL
jgi:hypothetical protein